MNKENCYQKRRLFDDFACFSTGSRGSHF